MSTSDIPAGIQIDVGGGHYWAVSNPRLVPAEVDATDRVVRWKFVITMYCGPNPPVGCNVWVDTFARGWQQ
jgi:hypothetical protein